MTVAELIALLEECDLKDNVLVCLADEVQYSADKINIRTELSTKYDKDGEIIIETHSNVIIKAY